ncbi:malectin domain-containing carbohydrate-binding protein [Haladaptatus sp. R4]|uniref:malectin domain-containing carbohydrate-binding protein n=1 Tax=Haladaptatus sp. R4 TaxID=1679489 RepID=UPI0009EF5397|nr:malectin domain-containing carbohydrate-binding protein [Haladaptatus sp. R4]
MSGSSSGGFIQGILIGGGVVFFVAGLIIVAGIPGGILGPAGSTNGGANASPGTSPATTSVEATSTAATTTQTTKSATTTPKTTATPTSTTSTTTSTTSTTQTTQLQKTVRYRVNVGGPQLKSSDGGRYWLADTEDSPSRFNNARISGSHTNSTNDYISMTSAVPSGTPKAMFQSRRYDADVDGKPSDDTEMQYRFPVQNGRYEVRLYFVESYFDKQSYKKKGPRKFDVEIEGKRVLKNYDMFKELGHNRGTMKSYTVTVRDGVANVKFIHEKEDPMLSGIEIVRVQGGKQKGGKQNDRQSNDVNSAQKLAPASKSN